MLIRTAVVGDLAAITQLSAGLFAEDAGTRDPHTDPTWPARAGRDYFAGALARSDVAIFVADDAGPQGYLLARLRAGHSLRPGLVVAEIESMYVTRTHRSAGVGTRLIERFSAWARERGANRMSVTAYAANRGARQLYTRMGFAEHAVTLEGPVA